MLYRATQFAYRNWSIPLEGLKLSIENYQWLPTMFVTRAERLNSSMPLLTRLLYGGITEELLLR